MERVIASADWFRLNETVYAKNRIQHGESYLLTGMPGVGKSSFLRLVRSRILPEDKTLPVLVDLNFLHEITSENVYKLMIERLNFEAKTSKVYRDLFQLAPTLVNSPQRIVFLIDRFEKAVHFLNSSFFDSLRVLIEESRRNIVFILSLDQNITDLLSYQVIDQFYTLVAPFSYYLQPFNEREALYYIENKAKERDLKLSPAQISEIYEWTGGHNRLINAYILDLLETNGHDFAKRLEHAGASEATIYQCRSIFSDLQHTSTQTLVRIITGLFLTLQDENNLEYLKKLGILAPDGKFFSRRFEDYIVKQFAPARSVLLLDDITGQIFKNGVRIDDQLSSNEYRFLKYLMENIDRVVGREEIVEIVWGVKMERGVSDEAVDQLVSRIREKIEDYKTNPRYLITIRGRGFQLKVN
jgi:DNA polymerase III delta prime subunit